MQLTVMPKEEVAVLGAHDLSLRQIMETDTQTFSPVADGSRGRRKEIPQPERLFMLNEQVTHCYYLICPFRLEVSKASWANSQLLPWTLGKGVVRDCSFIELCIQLLKWICWERRVNRRNQSNFSTGEMDC